MTDSDKAAPTTQAGRQLVENAMRYGLIDVRKQVCAIEAEIRSTPAGTPDVATRAETLLMKMDRTGPDDVTLAEVKTFLARLSGPRNGTI